MQNTDLYSNTHLVVAAIRVLTHQKKAPPSIDEVCQALSFSLEQGNFICNKLKETGIIEVVEGAYGTRLFIKNHLKIEDIPKGDKVSTLEEELKKFQNSKKNFTKKIESFQAKQAKKQKTLFAELEKKLKQETDKKKS
ncbi:MAG: hypothetical protein V3S16_14620 [Candidatus Desulfatibia sp.]|jgi:DNA-binding IscR family transcriptional regulator|uniref:hypothetical protein n=1 Tax=Candidatus Desulfatibia sp. TaxID=3101189 RepID=UPI002F2BBC5A